MFEGLDISPIVKLREKPLRKPAFVVDVNLGRLARKLRLLGFDTLFSNSFRDDEIVAIAAEKKRIVLTRDRRLLHAKAVTHGYWVRSVLVARQVEEVLHRFDLAGQVRPFSLRGLQRINRPSRRPKCSLIGTRRRSTTCLYRCRLRQICWGPIGKIRTVWGRAGQSALSGSGCLLSATG